MCEPVSIALLAGAALSAYTQHQSGEAQAKAGDMQRQAASEQAIQTNQQGASQAALTQQQAKLTIGSQAAGIGSSGVAVGSGSALNVLSDSSYNATLDSTQAIGNARNRSAAISAQGNLAAFQGRSDARAANWGAGASLLGGASKAYSAYRGY